MADEHARRIFQDKIAAYQAAVCTIVYNATFHKSPDTQTAIPSLGHTLEYLPAYSPDLNPIEHKWAQAKSARKKLQCSVTQIFESNHFI
jgi:transposase